MHSKPISCLQMRDCSLCVNVCLISAFEHNNWGMFVEDKASLLHVRSQLYDNLKKIQLSSVLQVGKSHHTVLLAR